MTASEAIKSEIFSKISELLEDESLSVSDGMLLIGSDSALNSMKLVELCLALEDMASILGFEFNWTSEVAMSRSRSIFRTAGTLADEFIRQYKAHL